MCMSGNLSENWKFWKQKFTNYLNATELAKKEETTKVAQLLTLIGDEGLRIYNTFQREEDKTETLKDILKKFEDHFNPQKNLTYERFKFLTCRQKEGQTMDQFTTELKGLSLSCEFEGLKDSLIRCILIIGLKNQNIREKLMTTEGTLEEAIKICINSESTREQNRKNTNGHSSSEVDALERWGGNSRHHPNTQNRCMGSKNTSQPPRLYVAGIKLRELRTNTSATTMPCFQS